MIDPSYDFSGVQVKLTGTHPLAGSIGQPSGEMLTLTETGEQLFKILLPDGSSCYALMAQMMLLRPFVSLPKPGFRV